MDQSKLQYVVCAIIGVVIFFTVKYIFDSKNESEEEKVPFISIIAYSLISGIGMFFISLFAYNKYIEYKSSRMILKDDYYS